MVPEREGEAGSREQETQKGDETRLNLDLQLPDGSDVLALLDEYDRTFQDQLKATPKSTYHPMVSRDEGGNYPATFRVKVNTLGLQVAKF